MSVGVPGVWSRFACDCTSAYRNGEPGCHRRNRVTGPHVLGYYDAARHKARVGGLSARQVRGGSFGLVERAIEAGALARELGRLTHGQLR
jgi:hypothetical protein